jgi:ATP adenylyltransferase
MVIPDAHVEDPTDLDDAALLDHARLKAATLAALRRDMDPDGVNTGQNLGGDAAGGSIDHLHTHVVPRWSGDTNFMSTTAETRVLPEDLRTTYRKLRRAQGDGPPS